LKGKVVLINLWFIGCPPCVTEIPMLNELQNELGAKGFVILSFGRDDAQSIEEFRRENPMHFSVFANSKELMVNTFKMNFGFPTNVFLDRNGRIVELRTGGAMDEAGLRKTKEEFKTLIEDKLKK
jgi:thiol-disulfide isomerase/thioredoxin